MKAVLEVVVGGSVIVTWEPLHGFSGRCLFDDVEEDPMSSAVLEELWYQFLIEFNESNQKFSNCPLCPAHCLVHLPPERVVVVNPSMYQVAMSVNFFWALSFS